MFQLIERAPNDWKSLTDKVHLSVFGSHLNPGQERITFALLGYLDTKFVGFVTCLETDNDTLYWKFGGVIRDARPTSLSWSLYQEMIEHCKAKYKRITTYIENDNITMLKFAMKIGFRIIGVRLYNGQVLVEHLLERGV